MDKEREVQNAQVDPQCVTDAVWHGALNSLPALSSFTPHTNLGRFQMHSSASWL